MPHIHSFAPIEGNKAKLLILGSMPGEASLQADEYYAHPRNAFWPIMGDLVGAGTSLPYEMRIQKLESAGIALWDVLASCIRHSSMDADIEPDSICTNDFASFFLKHPFITQVFFNGAMAEQFFLRHVQHSLGSRQLNCRRLPSTSPANASMRYEQKLGAWKVILDNISGTELDR